MIKLITSFLALSSFAYAMENDQIQDQDNMPLLSPHMREQPVFNDLVDPIENNQKQQTPTTQELVTNYLDEKTQEVKIKAKTEILRAEHRIEKETKKTEKKTKKAEKKLRKLLKKYK